MFQVQLYTKECQAYKQCQTAHCHLKRCFNPQITVAIGHMRVSCSECKSATSIRPVPQQNMKFLLMRTPPARDIHTTPVKRIYDRKRINMISFLRFYFPTNWLVSWLIFWSFIHFFRPRNTDMVILPQLMLFTAQFCLFSIFQPTFDEFDYVQRVSRFLSALRSTKCCNCNWGRKKSLRLTRRTLDEDYVQRGSTVPFWVEFCVADSLIRRLTWKYTGSRCVALYYLLPII